jgi:alkylated DNA repair protein alkB homolog 8
MCRILKPGGQALVTVWAKEQKYKNKESYYISQKKETTTNNNNNETEQNPLVHKFGKEFEKKDLFVAWHYNPKTMPKNKLDENSNKLCISEDTKKEEKVYLRFYHVI